LPIYFAISGVAVGTSLVAVKAEYKVRYADANPNAKTISIELQKALGLFDQYEMTSLLVDSVEIQGPLQRKRLSSHTRG
jgi:hypothetical protein